MKPRIAWLVLLGIVSSVLLGCTAEAAEKSPTIAIHHSRFVPGAVSIKAGVPVTILLQNNDPIEHEWIVGTEEVHEVHRKGTEASHDSRPTELTLPAFTSKTTTITFDAPGNYAFICHLPGHEAYGMRGVLKVGR